MRPSAEKNRGRPVRGRARRRRRAGCTATAARSPSRWTTAQSSATHSRIWNRRRARSPSCRDPCSRPRRGSPGPGTPAACARTAPASPFAPNRIPPPATALPARRASPSRPAGGRSPSLRGNPGVNRAFVRPCSIRWLIFAFIATDLQLHLSEILPPPRPGPPTSSPWPGRGRGGRAVGKRVAARPVASHVADNTAQETSMAELQDNLLPPTFNRLAWSNLAAQFAEQIALAAAPIVAVLLLGVGEGQTGLLQTALTLPFILFAIPAGLLADRISRRWLMAGSEALRAAALLGVLLLIWLGLLTLPLLALLGFIAVCGTVAYSVAAPALVPSLVLPNSLPAANARIELARTVAFASGPALGGVLVGWVGAAPAFGFAAALSVSAVVLLSGIYEPPREPAPRRHPLQEIKEGAAFVLHHPLLRPVFATQFIFNIASFLVLAVFVPYAIRRLGLSASGVGTTLAMYGVGMVVGALAATRVMKRLAFGTVIGLGPVTGFVAAAVMALTTVIATPLLAGLSFFLLGVGPILWVISTTTLRQSVTPPSLLGRVSAINIMSYGARPVGSALGAIVGGLYSAEACLYLAVVIFGAQALVILMSPAVSLARQPQMVGEPVKALRAC